MRRAWLACLLLVCSALPSLADDKQYDYAVDSGGILYRIDLDNGTYASAGRIGIQTESGRTLHPSITDLAATPDGYLYGISFDGLYLINISDPSQSKRIGTLGISGANSMTLGPKGRILVTNLAGQVYHVDLETGHAEHLGALGGGLVSSGDSELVGEVVYMTTKDSEERERLARIDPETGQATDLGELRDLDGRPVRDVWGMINRKGRLYGLTAAGDVVRIDPTAPDKCVRVLRTKIVWWGATAYVRF